MIWEYISSYILSPDKSQIQEERLEDFTIFLGHEGCLAHTDIIVNALEPTICDEKKCKALSFAFNRVHRNLWESFCYGESVGTSQELTRFFYIETEE